MKDKPKVYFVGAGPGDPGLITKKGDELLKLADHIIFTGSLINKEVLNVKKSSCKTEDSSKLTKEEIIGKMSESALQGKIVVRLHTGDPSLYGAIQEQVDALKEKSINIKIIPGISAFQGSASSLQRELTLPGITQTVVLSRIKGKTSLPGEEDLKDIASLKTTLCLYLSVHDIGNVVKQLTEGGLEKTTPVAVIFKATWPEEKIYKTALIIVGKVLEAEKENYQDSKLYHPNFEHEYRKKQEKNLDGDNQ